MCMCVCMCVYVCVCMCVYVCVRVQGRMGLYDIARACGVIRGHARHVGVMRCRVEVIRGHVGVMRCHVESHEFIRVHTARDDDVIGI